MARRLLALPRPMFRFIAPCASFPVIAALLVAACGATSTSTATGPTPVKCAVSLVTSQNAIAAVGGAGAVTVTTQPECAWTATAEGSWISDLAPASGQGSGEVQFRASPNPDGTTRQAAIEVNGQRAVIRQDASPCQWELAVNNDRFDVAGGVAIVQVFAPGGCAWTASSSDGWIIIAAPGAGAGRGSVTFRVTANAGQARSGTIAIGGVEVTVTQDGVAGSPPPPDGPQPPIPQPLPVVPACTRSLQPTAASIPSSGGSGALTMTTPANCAWTASSLVPWVTISTGASGSGSATITFSVAANAGAARTGTLDIGGATFTVNQAGASQPACSVSIDRTSQSVAVGGTAGVSVAVSAGAGCPWTAASNAAWITITAGATGSGNGKVTFNVAANTGSARTGTLTIAGNTFTVDQAGVAQPVCSVSIDRNSQSVAAGGTTGVSVAVSAGAGCGWPPDALPTWITITAGATGSGNGKVTFNVAANTGSARTGTLTIGGNVFTVSQAAAAACSYAIAPSSQSIGASGGGGSPVAVSTTSGCSWTATSNAAWLTVTSGASGTGDGNVSFSAAANTGSARTGTLTIAGQTFTVNQATGCSYSIDPVAQSMSAAGGAGTSIAVSTASGCGWTAASSATWLTITSGSSGTGNGTVTFSAAPNTSTSGRAGTLTIAGRTFAVLQAGACTYSISPSSATFGRKGGDGEVAVSAPGGCAWTATSDAASLTITSGASDSGDGTVEVKVEALSGNTRTGVLTIAGQTFTVTQTASDN